MQAVWRNAGEGLRFVQHSDLLNTRWVCSETWWRQGSGWTGGQSQLCWARALN
uniref:Uncharacterized protein n=1 Tax=Arundo donax TaxID=35708 RepID=A0A0A9B4E8_ARUDO